jgi:hypothetical protein
MTLEEYFWSKVDGRGDAGCWNWSGPLNAYGYGVIRRVCGLDRGQMAHRFAYELLRDPIPEGLTLDHLCRNRACVNPGHLEPVTNKENILRGIAPPAINAAKTHCIHGHPFTEDNTYREPKNPDGRVCRACIRERSARKRVSPEARQEARQRSIAGLLAWQKANRPTHCPNGHPYSGDNLVRDSAGRHCLTCRRAKNREAWRRSRGRGPAGGASLKYRGGK